MSPLSILVSGMLAGDPGQGGASWAVLQYVLGLRRLGHDVSFAEPVDDLAASAPYFRRLSAEFGLDGHAAILARGTRRTVGLTYDELRDRARRADVLLNISGLLAEEELLDPIPVRAYLDLDPGFTQLWQAGGIDMGLGNHTQHFTVGGLLGTADCQMPSCGVRWIATLPPVVLERWSPASELVHDAFTSVANLRSYGSIDHDGRRFGQKLHSLRELLALPARTDEQFVLALAAHPDEHRDLAALRSNGWHLIDPRQVAGTPSAYRAFVCGSRAELGVAKHGYVEARCGWFSDRSACYLAAGRPVLAQETGFSRLLPTGSGLLSFTGVEDALVHATAIRDDYQRHARAARGLAEEWFDSDRVLTRLLSAVGV